MPRDFMDPRAIIKSAHELAERAAGINAEQQAGEAATKKGREHWRRAGEMPLIHAPGNAVWFAVEPARFSYGMVTADRTEPPGACIRATEQCLREQRSWIAWLKSNVKFSRSSASSYMRTEDMLDSISTDMKADRN